MANRGKYKFGVIDGERRSSVWTVAVNREDIYLTSSRMKHDKISLHASGQGNWSLKTEALNTAPFKPNGGRHVAQWHDTGVLLGRSKALFFLLIPETELVVAYESLAPTVKAIAAPPSGYAVKVMLAVSPHLPRDQRVQIAGDSVMLLFDHRMQDSRALLAIAQVIAIPPSMPAQMDAIRRVQRDKARAYGLADATGTRATVRIDDARGVPGIIELAPL
ncbi:hypothetical protein [Luteibacter sp. Lutesp34]|uniref:hypothetical protein n=1 Tax=Luteibacter sp. Lutesp34 TaxID=3243030 RepID=UPI0039B550CF